MKEIIIYSLFFKSNFKDPPASVEAASRKQACLAEVAPRRRAPPLAYLYGREKIAKEGKSLPWKLMFDMEIVEVYSVNQEVDIGEEVLMKLRLLLFILYQKLKKAAKKNAAYQSFLANMQVKIMIKTADGKHGRLFIFDRGKLSTLTGAMHPYDAALVWSDSDTAFKVLSSRSDEQTFRAAADGKLKVDGMVAYVQWFTDGVKLVMK